MDTVDFMPSPQPNRLRKQSLEPWQVEDADRLRALFILKTKLSQAEFGEIYGIGTQGMVWQYLNARRPLNPRAAKAFADGLGLTIADISPTLAAKITSYASTGGSKSAEFMEKCLDMSGDEWAQMGEYADFLRSKRKR